MDTSPTKALEELAAGAMRGPPARAHALFDAAWPLFVQRLGTFLGTLRVAEDLWEDCGQAVLLRVWRGREGYAGTSTGELMAWIFKTCEREHLRLLESRTRRRAHEPDAQLQDEDESKALDPASEELDPTGRAVEELDLMAALEDCLERLQEAPRRAVELLYSSLGPTEREAALLLECSKSQVHALRKAAIDQLAHCLKSKGVE